MGAEPKVKWVVDMPLGLHMKLEKKREGLSRREFLELVAEDDLVEELVKLKKRVKELERELNFLKTQFGS